MVYAWFKNGLRMAYAKFTQSLRRVDADYAEFTQSLRKVYAGLRKVYAEFMSYAWMFMHVYAEFTPVNALDLVFQ